MKLSSELRFTMGSQDCVFRTLRVSDVTDSYVSALRVQRDYLANNPSSITLEWQRNYVGSILAAEADTIAGLFVDGELVGTSGIQGLHVQGVPAVGIFVLSPEDRGRGYGRALVWAASTILRARHSVAGIEAGMEKANTASLRAFLSCGFTVTGETANGGTRVRLALADLRAPVQVSNVILLDADEPSLRQVDAVLACRLKGTRLYGKPLQLIDVVSGVTILENLVRHLQSSPTVRSINLAIADEEENWALARMAERNGWRHLFGDSLDVLGRILKVVDAFDIGTVLRVTTECPFVHHLGIDPLVHSHFQTGSDYSMYRDLPEGVGFSLIASETLRKSHREGEHRHRSELVTSYIFDNRDSFQLNIHELPEVLRRPDVRVTVDYPEDLVFCRKVYRDLGGSERLIPLQDIVSYWDRNTELRKPVEQIGVDWGHGRLWQ